MRREGSVFHEAPQEAETSQEDNAGSDTCGIGQGNLRRRRPSATAGVTSWKRAQVTASPSNAGWSLGTPAKREGNRYLAASPGRGQGWGHEAHLRKSQRPRRARPFAQLEDGCYCMVKKCQRNGPFGLINGIH